MADDLLFHIELEDLLLNHPHRRPRIFRRRPNYFEEYRDFEFLKRFRLSKETVQVLIAEIGPQIAPTVYRYVLCI